MTVTEARQRLDAEIVREVRAAYQAHDQAEEYARRGYPMSATSADAEERHHLERAYELVSTDVRKYALTAS